MECNQIQYLCKIILCIKSFVKLIMIAYEAQSLYTQPKRYIRKFFC